MEITLDVIYMLQKTDANGELYRKSMETGIQYMLEPASFSLLSNTTKLPEHKTQFDKPDIVFTGFIYFVMIVDGICINRLYSLQHAT